MLILPPEPFHAVPDPDTDMNYNNLDEYKFITASATKISRRSTIGGIDVLNKASGKLPSVEKISDSIIAAEFNSSPQITFTVCYCRNNTSEEKLMDAFYSDLKKLTESVHTYNFRDFNGKIHIHTPFVTFPFAE